MSWAVTFAGWLGGVWSSGFAGKVVTITGSLQRVAEGFGDGAGHSAGVDCNPVLGQLEVLKLVASRLDDAGIPYMLTGSVAAGYYSEPRTTRDIDLVVELEAVAAERLASLFADAFDVSEDSIRRAADRQTMFNLIHTEAIVKVDFIVRKSSAYHRAEFDRRRTVTIDGQRMWIASPEDVILSKLLWLKQSGSEIQRRDVRRLLQLAPALDREYLDGWAASLSVVSLLTELSA